ncbi:hypothetical protein [Dongia deserti]|uniref:hypothetical protein n=1 Tax=Dongia deserti TaxID=2268030 RepID=UPI000E64F900|nr:hypothetical protein [Dongia deserti]
MEDDKKLVVTPPELRDGGGKALTRILLEMAAQATPVTAALAHLYGYTHPSQFEQDLQRFRTDVAQKLTDHEEQLRALTHLLSPMAVIGETAMQVAIHLLRINTTGRSDPVPFEKLVDDLKHIPRDRLEESVAELSAHGFVTTAAASGHAIINVRPTNAAFLAFDQAATGRDIQADAVHVASLWLEDEQLRNVFKLSEHLGWEPRRLNPALGALRTVFAEGRWSKERHLMLETTSVLVTLDERFKLRQIVESGRVG